MTEPTGAMIPRRLLCALIVLAPLAGGCAQSLDLGILYAAPGKYDYLRCEDLPARLVGAIEREKKLEDLIARANQDAAGPIVSQAAYSADLAQAKAEQRTLRAAAVDKKCGSIEPGSAPSGAAPPPPAPRR
jgi:hypothetical protein